MHAVAGQRIEVRRQRRGQGFTFTGAHLRNAAFMQGDAANQLHIEVTHAKHAGRGLAHHGKGFRQQLVERLALLEGVLELRRLVGQLDIRQRRNTVTQPIDLGHDSAHALELAVIFCTENLFNDRSQHERSSLLRLRSVCGMSAAAKRGDILPCYPAENIRVKGLDSRLRAAAGH